MPTNRDEQQRNTGGNPGTQNPNQGGGSNPQRQRDRDNVGGGGTQGDQDMNE
jgi:hypothetical protein